ncbi:unnamed protein product, partial [Chrysoparadoxa australica]
DRYYSQTARVVAVIATIFISFTYVAGQMRGVGIVFSRFLDVSINTGVVIGMIVVFFYAVMGGMKGITYTQVAQYVILITAYLVPAIFISIMMTGKAIPQLGFGSTLLGEDGVYLLDKLDGLNQQLGFNAYTEGTKSRIDVFFITAALMLGTAGLPHVIVRFFTVPKVKDARKSVGWSLVFIALLYTVAPAIGAFSRTNLIQTISKVSYESAPQWFKNWETTGLIAWVDKNSDGIINYHNGEAFSGKPVFVEGEQRGPVGQRLLENKATSSENELYFDRDIMVLANPEIAKLPNWVVALIAAGALAAALSTAAGLLLTVSTSIAHDLLKKNLKPDLSEKEELKAARISAGLAVVVAGYFGIHPPGFVAQVVALAFGLAASSIFPALLLGIFDKRMNKEGAITGMLCGLFFTIVYIVYFKFVNPEINNAQHWFFGISPEGIGTIGAFINWGLATVVSRFTAAPPQDVQDMVEDIRIPRGSKSAAAAH